jgi:DNA segregation ATPase FtsK/SpoIIIE, S-DNA-T family
MARSAVSESRAKREQKEKTRGTTIDQPADDLTGKARILFERLNSYLVERVTKENRLRTEFEGRKSRLIAEHRSARKELKTRAESQFGQTHDEFERLQQEAHDKFEKARRDLEQQETSLRQSTDELYHRRSREAASSYKNQRWETQTAYAAQRTGAKEIARDREKELLEKSRKFQSQEDRLIKLLESRRMGRPLRYAVPLTNEPLPERPEEALVQETEAFERGIDSLERLSLPRLVGPQLSLIFLASFLLLVAMGCVWVSLATAILVAGVGSMVLGGIVSLSLYMLARQQVAQMMKPITGIMARVVPIERHARAQIAAAMKESRSHLRRTHRRDLGQLRDRFDAAKRLLLEERSKANRHADEHFPRQLAEITQERDDTIAELQEKYLPVLRQWKAEFSEESETLDRANDITLGQVSQSFDSEWNEFVHWCRTENEAILSQSAELERQSAEAFPDWETTNWQTRPAPTCRPPGLRLGSFRVHPPEITPTKPTDPMLAELTPPSLDLPAALRWPDRMSLLIETTGAGFGRAHELLSLAMLRLLISTPPGKVRMTILDPVGLGQEFSAFMHLADHDESLVGARIWTESAHIEQRLTDLTEHLENVIQKYLRNVYESIDAYNADAGEIAEPYRVLVVGRFPVGFNDDAVRRLMSLASAGAKCGVYLLMSIDTKVPLPAGFSLAELERHAVVLRPVGDSFRWQESPWSQLSLKIDPPASAESMTRILKVVGEQARLASRVEVPFRIVAATDEAWWIGDSRREIRIPLGRCGATKLQYLSLGQGTSQHVLIAGKTGSGKSTLLHALITSAAIRYRPDQLAFYLIDFKKGVEFKAYATHALPHARVIAIESEREFGLSVMQRLDAELQTRGSLFRDVGVQDLASYRDLSDRQPDLPPMPRILFIVDEFQEFFVSDDRIAQDAALLLDRLVRQGRAFGIHVMLGSQTLGGAYSLARSTLGQMAVRIALQCSEADAHLILSEDNTAARLLNRPGEAIYNDANGRIEGNNPFQTVWLPDHEREEYLHQLQVKYQEWEKVLPPAVIFEGNAPSSLSMNPALHERLSAVSPIEGRSKEIAWLGEPIEIKASTSIEFTRQSGSNVLILGQESSAARGVMASILISLGTQKRPRVDRLLSPPAGAGPSVPFYLLDGSDVSASDDRYESLPLAEVARQAGIGVESIERRRLTDSLSELVEEVSRRQQQEGQVGVEMYLFLFDIARFRDLRRGEDDFGFSMSADVDAPAKPDKLLATLVREGPAVGVHVIVWCDSLANFQRSFDRSGQREFGSRVLFQMSAADSSQLMDGPQASRLGAHRAFLHQEDLGRLEKFRPYALPDPAWLARLSTNSAPSNAAP